MDAEHRLRSPRSKIVFRLFSTFTGAGPRSGCHFLLPGLTVGVTPAECYATRAS
jgi:hypothetical protein